MAEVLTMSFRKLDGTVFRIKSHEKSAPGMRDHYEKKGYEFLGYGDLSQPVASAPAVSEEESTTRPGRRPGRR